MADRSQTEEDTSILDRRDSPRVPMRFWVREEGDASWTEYEGDLSVGGVFFKRSAEPKGNRFEIKLKLPDQPNELITVAELIRFGTKGDAGVHARFVDPSVQVELAIAKYLDELKR